MGFNWSDPHAWPTVGCATRSTFQQSLNQRCKRHLGENETLCLKMIKTCPQKVASASIPRNSKSPRPILCLAKEICATCFSTVPQSVTCANRTAIRRVSTVWAGESVIHGGLFDFFVTKKSILKKRGPDDKGDQFRQNWILNFVKLLTTPRPRFSSARSRRSTFFSHFARQLFIPEVAALTKQKILFGC